MRIVNTSKLCFSQEVTEALAPAENGVTLIIFGQTLTRLLTSGTAQLIRQEIKDTVGQFTWDLTLHTINNDVGALAKR